MKRASFLLAAALAAITALPSPVYGEGPAPAPHYRKADDGTDQRIVDLAEHIVRQMHIRKGEHVLISATCTPDDLVVELIRAVRYAGAIPHARIVHSRVEAEMVTGRTDEQFELEAKLRMEEAKAMDAVIQIYGEPTPARNRHTSKGLAALANKHFTPISLYQHEQKRWCSLFWPTAEKAKAAGMPHRELLDYYLKCCLMDFDSIRPAMEKLKAMMEAADEVRIVGPGTDLTFSIKGIPVVAGYGEFNMPDGEVFTAPVRESANGTLHVNLTSMFAGYPFEDINLRFENGKVVEITSADRGTQSIMRHILNRDEASLYLGEFALGVNPLMHKPIIDTLFDEKIAGSFHLALGRCVHLTPNGNNKTLLHWDLVVIQRPDYGGGEIYFDGKLIRKDGQFLDPDLAPLNPAQH